MSSASADALGGVPRLRATPFSGLADQIHYVYVERIRQAGERFPGQILFAALDP